MCDDLADREKRRVHTSQRPTRCSIVHTNLNSPEYISTTDNRAGSRHQQSHSHISVNVISR